MKSNKLSKWFATAALLGLFTACHSKKMEQPAPTPPSQGNCNSSQGNCPGSGDASSKAPAPANKAPALVERSGPGKKEEHAVAPRVSEVPTLVEKTTPALVAPTKEQETVMVPSLSSLPALPTLVENSSAPALVSPSAEGQTAQSSAPIFQ